MKRTRNFARFPSAVLPLLFLLCASWTASGCSKIKVADELGSEQRISSENSMAGAGGLVGFSANAGGGSFQGQGIHARVSVGEVGGAGGIQKAPGVTAVTQSAAIK